mgnify:CR=1 FL=1
MEYSTCNPFGLLYANLSLGLVGNGLNMMGSIAITGAGVTVLFFLLGFVTRLRLDEEELEEELEEVEVVVDELDELDDDVVEDDDEEEAADRFLDPFVLEGSGLPVCL